MKIEKAIITEVLKDIMPCVNVKDTRLQMITLSNEMDTLTITAFDGNMKATANVLTKENGDDFKVSVNAVAFKNAIDSFDGSIEITVVEKTLVLKERSYTRKLQLPELIEHIIEEGEVKSSFQLSEENKFTLFKGITEFTAREMDWRNLIHFYCADGKLTTEASNNKIVSSRMVVAPSESSEFDVLLPTDLVQSLERMRGDVVFKIFYSDNQAKRVSIENDYIVYSSSIGLPPYPKIKDVINLSMSKVGEVVAEDFIEAMQKLKEFTGSCIKISNAEIQISAKNENGSASLSVDADTFEPPIQFKLNPAFACVALSQFKGDSKIELLYPEMKKHALVMKLGDIYALVVGMTEVQ